jgi:hypothetical protein
MGINAVLRFSVPSVYISVSLEKGHFAQDQCMNENHCEDNLPWMNHVKEPIREETCIRSPRCFLDVTSMCETGRKKKKRRDLIQENAINAQKQVYISQFEIRDSQHPEFNTLSPHTRAMS